jgi:UDP-N-acetylglucosamine:LPS N-acetylglucosamine transferase
MKAIVEKYNIGEMITGHDPAYLAGKLDEMLNNKEKLAIYHENLKKAASELCWENEQKELIRIFQDYV